MIISLNSVFLTEGDIFTFALYSYKAFFLEMGGDIQASWLEDEAE